jgi:predicted protein tyrosine phosphatase
MTAEKTKVHFVCDKNRLRSATAERLFGDHPQLEVRSAGVDKDATVVVSRELLEWADLVFVMEKRQRNIIHSRFNQIYKGKQIVCLYVPDEFDFMDPLLIALLKDRVTDYLLKPRNKVLHPGRRVPSLMSPYHPLIKAHNQRLTFHLGNTAQFFSPISSLSVGLSICTFLKSRLTMPRNPASLSLTK